LICLGRTKRFSISCIIIRVCQLFSEIFEEVLAVCEKNPLFRLRPVTGSHFVHLNSPEIVYPHIQEFLENTAERTSKL
jgi:hypothetical protein